MKKTKIKEKLIELSISNAPSFWNEIEGKLGPQPINEIKRSETKMSNKFPIYKLVSIAASVVIVFFAFTIFQNNKPKPTREDLVTQNDSAAATTADQKAPQIGTCELAQFKEMPIPEIEKMLEITINEPKSIPQTLSNSKMGVYYSTDSSGKINAYSAQLLYEGKNDKSLTFSIRKQEDEKPINQKVDPSNEIPPDYQNVPPEVDGSTANGEPVAVPAPAQDLSSTSPSSIGNTKSKPPINETSIAPGSPDPSTGLESGTGSAPGYAGSGKPVDLETKTYTKKINQKVIEFFKYSDSDGKFSSISTSFDINGVIYDVSTQNIEASQLEAILETMIK